MIRTRKSAVSNLFADLSAVVLSPADGTKAEALSMAEGAGPPNGLGRLVKGTRGSDLMRNVNDYEVKTPELPVKCF